MGRESVLHLHSPVSLCPVAPLPAEKANSLLLGLFASAGFASASEPMMLMTCCRKQKHRGEKEVATTLQEKPISRFMSWDFVTEAEQAELYLTSFWAIGEQGRNLEHPSDFSTWQRPATTVLKATAPMSENRISCNFLHARSKPK